MQKVTVKNVSRALQGFNHTDGQKWLAPGESGEFVVSDDERAFMAMRDGLEVSGAEIKRDPLDHDNDGIKGGSLPVEKRGPGRPKKDAE